MFDINGGEFLVLIVVALLILGPERLPQYAAQLARLVREARTFAGKAREQVKAEMGDEFDDVDWKALDPRRYDPRRIVREALLDGDDDPLGLNGWNTSDSAPNVPDNMRPEGTEDSAETEPAASPTSVVQSYDADAT
ncbi:Sec-independent protein translocase TatB [Angustibacter sp. McL0619]|uniref:Sec-independent protein translocase TatB n=1 Tax=Angustibacter sp. McL0619 TaxID=3415676 RepID=UPI003CE87C01